MLQQKRNMNNDKNKEEIDNDSDNKYISTAIFRQNDFKDKEVIYILAKTWGAARLFYNKTALRKFKNVKIEYLHLNSQLGYGVNKSNTVVIKLSRADETAGNLQLQKRCVEKNIRIINYSINVID